MIAADIRDFRRGANNRPMSGGTRRARLIRPVCRVEKGVPEDLRTQSLALSPCRDGIFRMQHSDADDRIALMNQEESYTCDACGEEIVIPIDPTAGADQEYVEDCPVCCNPNVIHVEISGNGRIAVWAKAE